MSDVYERDECETDLSYARRIAGFEYSRRLRAWAKEQGLSVNERGRIPSAVMAMYAEATGDDLTATLARIDREHRQPGTD
ncbi:histone-like nucleoid-structuring protein Lsr2 [Actinomadura sp. LOL_016]|uniref:Lsr2 family DNA-binding protein n=1 Tax=unclassified Actinomadura TaxID=2626254 RepID=UPI003A8097DF